jgi:hypothetical protein
MSSSTLAGVDDELHDPLLPWVIDLFCFAAITHWALLADIERVGNVVIVEALGYGPWWKCRPVFLVETEDH